VKNMEIKYLKKMQKTRTIDDRDNEGISEAKINEIELETGKKFPDVFREFLFLGGNEANMIADMDNGCFLENGDKYWQEMQQYCRDEMASEGVQPEKDFWAFAALDGGEQFHFFYFDDGEDPPVYYYCSYHDNFDTGEEYAGIVKISPKFSEHINQVIESRKKSGY
jgi:SMI1 / KNR4 family (SUKH-1)